MGRLESAPNQSSAGYRCPERVELGPVSLEVVVGRVVVRLREARVAKISLTTPPDPITGSVPHVL